MLDEDRRRPERRRDPCHRGARWVGELPGEPAAGDGDPPPELGDPEPAEVHPVPADGAGGVGVGLGCYRIIVGLPLHYFIAAGYLVVIVPMPLNLAVFAPGRAAEVMAAYPGIELEWVVLPENELRGRVTTDTATGAGSFEEDNFFSKIGLLDSTAELRGSVPVPEETIDSLKIMVNSDHPVTTGHSLQKGDKVLVLRGPFAGVTGTFVRYGGKGRVIVNIEALGQYAGVEVSEEDIEIIPKILS